MRLVGLILFIILLIPVGVATKISVQGEHNPAAPPLILTNERDKYPLDLHLDYLEDPGGQLTIEDISSPEYAGQFTFSQGKVPKFGYSDSAFWVRFRVRNETTHSDDWLLEHDFANNQHISFYLDGPDQRTVNTGTLHPFQTRDVPYHRFIFKLPLPPGAEQTVYLRAQSQGTILFPLILWRAETFGEQSRNDLFIEGLFFGALLLMAGYNVFIWFFLRDRSYLYYALFVVGIILHQFSFEGFAGQYLWPDQPWLYRYAILFWALWLLFFAILSAVSLLQTKTQAPLLHKIILLFLVLSVLILFQLPFVKYSLVARQINVLVGAGFVLLTIAGFIIWRKGYRPARYYLLAWSAPLVVNIVSVLALLNLSPLAHPSLFRYLHAFGMVWLGLFLSLALADRINIFKQEREEAQSAALQASQKHERLVQEQNIILEQQVTERTAALAQSNKELAAAKETAEKAQNAAEAANQAKSVFLANMSHELRTPLNGILGYAQLLELDQNLTHNQHYGLSIIHQSGEHLLSLINGILDLAKIEAGRFEVTRDYLQLHPLLDNIAAILKMRAQQKGIRFDYHVAGNVPPVICSDETRLRQILLNLLGNAVKFTTAGSVTLRVSLASNHSSSLNISGQETIRFDVIDTGPGIPAEALESIFQPFEQAGSGRQRTAGTGLGLTISRQLARLMNGDIYVESQVGQGSHFWLELTTAVIELADQQSNTAGPQLIGVAGDAPTVLVVDDLTTNQQVLTSLLEVIGVSAIAADSGQRGLELAVEHRPAAAIVDLMMPEMDGFEMIRRLRAEASLGNLVIIATSASVYVEHQERSLAAGANGFLAKPVQLSELHQLLTDHLPFVEWVNRTEGPGEATEPTVMELPPPDLLQQIQQAVYVGDLRSLRAQIDTLKHSEAVYQSFVARLEELVETFEIGQLIDWMEELTGPPQ